jgi:hypothetical protein
MCATPATTGQGIGTCIEQGVNAIQFYGGAQVLAYSLPSNPTPASGFTVQGLGFRVEGLEFRV